jgi:hypothetical protein
VNRKLKGECHEFLQAWLSSAFLFLAKLLCTTFIILEQF